MGAWWQFWVAGLNVHYVCTGRSLRSGDHKVTHNTLHQHLHPLTRAHMSNAVTLTEWPLAFSPPDVCCRWDTRHHGETGCVTTHTHTECVTVITDAVELRLLTERSSCSPASRLWVEFSPALQLRPFAVAAHAQQTHTDVTAAHHLPGHKGLKRRWKAPGDTKKLLHSQSCVLLLQWFPTWGLAPSSGGGLEPLVVNDIVKVVKE